MKRCTAVAVLAGLFVWASAGHAQDGITIKLKTRGEGDVVLITKNETVTSKIKLGDGNGKVVLDQNKKEGEIGSYQETVLKRDGSKPATKIERSYTKCQIINGDKTEELEMQGKTVVIEKKGDKYVSTYKDGGPVVGKSAQFLSKEMARKRESSAELEKLMLPKGAVKPGETWKLDMEPILKELFKEPGGEIEVDSPKATGSGKLLKAYKKDGRMYGDIKYQLSMPLKSLGKGQGKVAFAEGAKMTMEMSLDVCIDGTSETGVINVKMTLAGAGQVAGAPGSSATIEIRSVTQGTQADPAKK